MNRTDFVDPLPPHRVIDLYVLMHPAVRDDMDDAFVHMPDQF